MPRRCVLTTERNGLVGHVLDDRYQVVKKLARGGMATVYVAHDLRLSRTVALKVMNEGLGDAADFAQRFNAEARAAAHLSHPNVVSVFDQGSDEGRPYIVMEYVEGFTLRQLITREAPMDPQRAISLIEPVTAALAAAHAAGLIHRDIKPENVLISDRGQVKVADFGLARAVTAHTSASTAGLVIGTVSYIAPELVTKGHADARSDVYSLGIVFYEMLTGRKPHTGDTPIQVAYSHVHNQITAPSLEVSTTWRDGRGGIPPYLDALVTTAASRERMNRPADAGVLLSHLRATRDAIERGVLDDPELNARVRSTDAGSATLPAPATPRMGAERHFTPVTPVSPSLDISADGAPFYSNGPSPYSPASPHTSSLPAVTERTPRSRPRWGRIVMLLTMLALVIGVSWGGWYMLEGRFTATPGLVRLTQTDAQAAAQASGVSVVFEREYSEVVPAGQVIRTAPETGGRMLRDGIVTAWISRGPERFTVPNVVGKTAEEATALIQSSSLKVGALKQENSDTIASGTVISQSTKPDTQAKRNDAVSLVVSAGPAPVDMVNFTGKKLADAQAWATANKIKLSLSEENHDSVPSGAIISQNPSSGALHRGGAMSMVVSKGPVMVTVPTGLRGQGYEAAAQRIRDAGLEPKFERLVNGGLGLVLSVQPGEGTSVPKGSTITLRLV